jgi:hypothetical protein
MPLSFNPSTFARTQKSTFENYTTAFTNQLAAHIMAVRESGGIGRRARLRIWSRKGWGFESARR